MSSAKSCSFRLGLNVLNEYMKFLDLPCGLFCRKETEGRTCIFSQQVSGTVVYGQLSLDSAAVAKSNKISLGHGS